MYFWGLWSVLGLGTEGHIIGVRAYLVVMRDAHPQDKCLGHEDGA